ncbi:MAG TPA: sigma-54 dependent transcriptional regulator [Vicinamibacteria bacterium]|nr:sigma-54 dependent transcriptional regulator [Vicinamibacteria bacterium]
MPSPAILVVDDEDLIRSSLRERLESNGNRVLEAGTGAQALASLEDGADLVLLDYRLPDADGLGLLKRIRAADPDALVILMTAYASVESAVEAMREGAYDYLQKPFDLEEVALLVERALETTRLRREVRALRARQSEPYSLDRIIGESPAMGELRALLGKIAASPASTVLLTGESGTGKDLAARCLHYASDRAAGAFMHITCSAVPEALLESELFGHERGAFTDARHQKKGLLELADRGTVYLDEVGEMAAALQAKLLRFLEEKSFKRVGGVADIRVDVRVIAATNLDLEKAVTEGRFRPDLYYRLRVLPVHLPPLRERRTDVPLLVKFMVDGFNREFRKGVRGVSPEAMRRLEAHGWPGNVRELKNAVERAVLLSERQILGPEDFAGLGPAPETSGSFRLLPHGIDFAALERDLVAQALERSGGNQTQAAALLGMSRDQIRYRIEKFELGDLEHKAE